MPAKYYTRPLLLLALILSGLPAFADILLLRNGDRVEGTILSEGPGGVRMRYRLTPRIFDEKTFATADIIKITKQKPEELELIELRKLLPTKNLLAIKDYEGMIEGKLKPFLVKYAGSPSAAEAQTILDTLSKERDLIVGGSIKHEGRWLTAKEASGERFNIAALTLLESIRTKASKGDLQGALRDFDRLSQPPPAFKGSIHSIRIIPEVVSIINRWIAELEKMSGEQPELLAKRTESLSKLKEPELSKVKNGIQDESARWRAVYDAERRQRIRWNMPYKFDTSSIQSAQKEAVEELTRLQTLPLDVLTPMIEVCDQCYRKVGAGEYMEAATLFERIQSINLPLEYRDITPDLRARILQLHGELSRAYASAASAASASGTGPSTGSSQGVNERMNQILAEGKTSPAAAPAATPAAKDGDLKFYAVCTLAGVLLVMLLLKKR